MDLQAERFKLLMIRSVGKDKQSLVKIAGTPDRVFAGMESENVKKVGLGKYLSCFKDDLTPRQRLFL
uniref:Uncharacterized protein n=1 Tax=Romanomermis culicivorax TaxID=13658 RepID=A0A915KWL4_ROMCU